jgi:hypothetical protein
MTNERLIDVLKSSIYHCKNSKFKDGLCFILISLVEINEFNYIDSWLMEKGFNGSCYKWGRSKKKSYSHTEWYAPRIEWLENQIKELKELENDLHRFDK